MLNTNHLLIIYLCATLSVACTSGKPANGTEDTLPDKERSMLYIENDRIKLGVDLSLVERSPTSPTRQMAGRT